METELGVLVERARQGDRPAFERVVVLTARLVYAQIVGSVRDRQRAEDLTQEAFLRAWRGLDTLAEAAGFVGWLLTIARHVVLDAGKTDARAKRGGSRRAAAGGRELEFVDGSAVNPGDTAAQAEERARLLEVLEGLPEEYRRVLMMRYLGGASYEDICKGLGLTDGALRGLLSRGMALLRERMTQVRTDKP
jgi:RNA polymerase sigma-70 factor (ECF subfamily)